MAQNGRGITCRTRAQTTMVYIPIRCVRAVSHAQIILNFESQLVPNRYALQWVQAVRLQPKPISQPIALSVCDSGYTFAELRLVKAFGLAPITGFIKPARPIPEIAV